MGSLADELRQLLASAEAGESFASRAKTLEQLEVHVFDRLGSIDTETVAIAEALRTRLQSLNEELFATLRQKAIAGALTAGDLTAHAGPPAHDGYDALDLIVEGLLNGGAPAEEQAAREPEMVTYQPTPARAVLQLARQIHAGDVFCDLGSGLGRVVILVALLSRTRAIGIEVEPSYVDYARRCAQQLNVQRVEWQCSDVRDASLAEPTAFFLYTPFRGSILRRVLDRLAIEAKSRPFTVFTFGTVTAEVAKEPWLRRESTGEISAFQTR
jgi:precorrin-6B methylase 2